MFILFSSHSWLTLICAVLVLDASAYFKTRTDLDKPLNFDELQKLPVHRKEVPEGSFVAVLHSAGAYQNTKFACLTMTLNVYAVVVLAFASGHGK